MIDDRLFAIRAEQIKLLPEAQHDVALALLHREQLQTQFDDANWRGWYEQYEKIVLNKQANIFFTKVRWGLEINLQAASFCVLIGSIFVPSVRHWWSFSLAGGWLLILLVEELNGFRQELFSTLDPQIAYLAEEDGRSLTAKAAAAS